MKMYSESDVDTTCLDGFVRLTNIETFGDGFVPAGTVATESNDNVKARVAEIEGVGAPLAAVSEDRDLLAVEAGRIDVGF